MVEYHHSHAVYELNQSVSNRKIHVYGNQGVDAVAAPLTVILYHPPGDFTICIPPEQSSAWLEILFPK